MSSQHKNFESRIVTDDETVCPDRFRSDDGFRWVAPRQLPNHDLCDNCEIIARINGWEIPDADETNEICLQRRSGRSDRSYHLALGDRDVLFTSPRMRGAYEVLVESGQCTTSEVADETGLANSTILEYMEILEGASLVEEIDCWPPEYRRFGGAVRAPPINGTVDLDQGIG